MTTRFPFLESLVRRSTATGLLALSLSCVPAQMARAEAVDTELLLLVDISTPGLTPGNFDKLISGYASAFSSTEVLDSIQSGATGKIAVAMMFFGNAGTQETAVPWMSISNASDAAQFASYLTDLSRPFSFGASEPGLALAAATQMFGLETGAAENGFDSATQIIEIAATGTANTLGGSTARDNALASGVDLINAISVGALAGITENYYAQNVIGSEIEGVAATSGTSSTNKNTLTTSLMSVMAASTTTGATISVTAVPEPQAPLLFASALGLGLLFRRRA